MRERLGRQKREAKAFSPVHYSSIAAHVLSNFAASRREDRREKEDERKRKEKTKNIVLPRDRSAEGAREGALASTSCTPLILGTGTPVPVRGELATPSSNQIAKTVDCNSIAAHEPPKFTASVLFFWCFRLSLAQRSRCKWFPGFGSSAVASPAADSYAEAPAV